MSVIVPNEILEVLICTVCKNYLSCQPTKNVKNGFYGSSIVCGRCDSQNENAVPSLFSKVAPYLLFPCIYRYEGCNQLLQCADVKNHEKICPAKKAHEGYACPICAVTEYSQSPLLILIDHYKTHHESLVLKEPSITVNLKTFKSSHYLYCDAVNNYIFLIFVCCTGGKLFLNASVIGKEANQVMQLLDTIEEKRFCTELNDNSEVFQIDTENLEIFTGKFQFKMLNVPALVLFHPHESMAATSPYFVKFPKIIYHQELLNKTETNQPKYKFSSCLTKLENVTGKSSISITCNLCENYLWDWEWNMLRLCMCLNQTCIICDKCLNSGSNACVMHRKGFCALYESPIFDLYFYCRFNCGLFFKLVELKKHENYCGNFSELEYVKQQFRHSTVDTFQCIRGNCVSSSYEYSSVGRKWYIVTHDGYKCILHIILNTGIISRFIVTHAYDKSKYYVMIRVCQGNVVKEEINEFQIDWNQSKNYYLVICFREFKSKPIQII